MKIPSVLPITAEQSRAARYHLGLTQANVIEQSELPGHKLKNFETGRFVPDMAFLQGLRDFYEGNGMDFGGSAPAQAAKGSADDKPKTPVGAGIVTPAQNGRFVVDPNLTMEQVDSILERMDANDAYIAELMQRKLEDGFLAGYSGQTDEDTRELFGLLAENYLHFRTLQGRNFLTPPPEARPQTQADLLSGLYANSVLIAAAPAPEDSPEEEEEA